MPIRAELRALYRTPEAIAAAEKCRARAAGKCERCAAPNLETINRPCEECDGTGEWADPCGGVMKCEACGGVGTRGVRIVLTVAHLDHDPAHNADANLQHLCQRCHLTHDAKQHATARRTNRDRRAGQFTFGEAAR